MPRTAREKANNGTYHVMLRGINKQNIFEESEDYEKLLNLLKEGKEKGGFELYAYCFMSNHIHLLIKQVDEPIEITFRRLGSKYVYWYNTKYERVGHLFQDRFKSEPVEENDYFLTVLRYIHYNPVKAGLTKNPAEYKYCSYNSYFSENDFIDTDRALLLKSKEELLRFHNNGCSDVCLDIPEQTTLRLTEEQAVVIMRSVTKCHSSVEFQALSKEKRDKLIAKMKSRGLSIRQISRLTGETYYIIQKI